MYSPSHYAFTHNWLAVIAKIKIRKLDIKEDNMPKDDFNKPPHVVTEKQKTQKKRLPVYMLILTGVFLIALLAYMSAENEPTAEDAPPDHPNPTAQPATPNNSTTNPPGDTGVATDKETATAKDY